MFLGVFDRVQVGGLGRVNILQPKMFAISNAIRLCQFGGFHSCESLHRTGGGLQQTRYEAPATIPETRMSRLLDLQIFSWREAVRRLRGKIDFPFIPAARFASPPRLLSADQSCAPQS